MSVIEAVDAVIADVDVELQRVFAPGSMTSGSQNTSVMYLGASPYYWGNLCDIIGTAMGWEAGFSSKPASIFGYVEMQANATADIASAVRQAVQNLYNGLRAEKQYAYQTAEFFATIAAQQGSGAAGSSLVAAENLFNRAEADIQARYLDAVHIAEHLYNLSVGTAQGLYASSVSHTNHLYNMAVAAERADVAAANAHTDASVAAANAHTDQLYNLSQSNLAGAVRSLTADMATERNQLEAEISNALISAESFATGAAISAAAAAATQLQTQLQPQIDKLKTEVDQCLSPLCDEVTPNAKSLGKLGRDLTALTKLGIAGLLMGLVAEAIADPEAAADQITGALGWTSDVAVELTDAVLG